MNTQPTAGCAGSCVPRVDLDTHPCYSRAAHFRFGRIHVPVAPRCNIKCNYCIRKYACPNENRPGVTMRVISPDEALDTVRAAIASDARLKVLGVAGPGDALANEATLATFERAGITTLTITINAVDPAIGEQIYEYVRYKGKTYRGRAAFELLHHNQMEGLREAAWRGMVVKVNSVLIPGVNDQHMPAIARAVKDNGAYIMNIIPMLPLAKFAHLPEPTLEQVNQVRNVCAPTIDSVPQLHPLPRRRHRRPR